MENQNNNNNITINNNSQQIYELELELENKMSKFELLEKRNLKNMDKSNKLKENLKNKEKLINSLSQQVKESSQIKIK